MAGNKLFRLKFINLSCKQLEDNISKWQPTNNYYYKQYGSSNLILGDRLISLGKLKDAIKIFKLSLKYDLEFKRKKQLKPLSKGYIKRGDTLLQQGKYEEAIEFYDISIKLDPIVGNFKRREAIVALGDTLIEKRSFSNIIEEQVSRYFHFDDYYYFRRKGNEVLKINKFHQALLFYRISLIMINDDNDYTQIKKCIKYGNNFGNMGLIEQASQMYQTAIDYALNIQGLMKSGYKSYLKGFVKPLKLIESDSDEECYDEFIKQEIKNEKYRNQHNQLIAMWDKHISLGDMENANQIFKQLEDNLIEWHPHNVYFYIQYGIRLITQGKVKQAIKIIKFFPNYINHSKQNAKAFIKLGDTLYTKRKYHEAIELYDISLILDVKVGSFRKGIALFELGLRSEAFKILTYASSNSYNYRSRADKFKQENKMELASLFYRLGQNTIQKIQAKILYSIKYNIEYKPDLTVNLSECDQFQNYNQFYQSQEQINQIQICLETGDTLIAQGQTELAFQMFNMSIQYNPDVQEYIKRGDYYLMEKEFKIAQYFYELLIKLDPIQGNLKKDLLISQGKIKEAFQMFWIQENLDVQEYIKRNHSDKYQRGDKSLKQIQYKLALQYYEYMKQYFLLKGDSLIAQEKMEEAMEFFNDSIQFNPDVQAFIQRGDQYYMDQQFNLAIYFYDLLIKFNPIQGYLKKGDALMAQGKNEEALLIFNIAIDYNPDWQEFKKRGDKCFQNNQFDLALQFYELLIKLNPIVGLLQKGDTLLLQKKKEQAFQTFKSAIEYNPDYKEYLNRGNSYFGQKKYELALQFYELSIKLNTIQGCLKKGVTLIAQGKIEEAFQILNNALQYNPNFYEYINIGNQYLQDKQYDLAVQIYDLSVKLNPIQCFLKKGDALIAKGRIIEAFQIFNNTIQYNPNLFEFQQRGDQYLNEQKYDIAFELYELMTKSNTTSGMLKKGDTLIAQGRIEDAQKIFNDIVNYSINDGLMPTQEFEQRGRHYFERQSYKIALLFYKILLNLYPENNEYQLNKGDLLLALGKIEEATKIYKYQLAKQSQEKISQQQQTKGISLSISSLRYLLQILTYKFQEIGNMDFNPVWSKHQVLILQEKGIYINDGYTNNKINYVDQELVLFK